jgi:hypothetical protein
LVSSGNEPDDKGKNHQASPDYFPDEGYVMLCAIMGQVFPAIGKTHGNECRRFLQPFGERLMYLNYYFACNKFSPASLTWFLFFNLAPIVGVVLVELSGIACSAILDYANQACKRGGRYSAAGVFKS